MTDKKYRDRYKEQKAEYMKEYLKKWRAANPEKIREYNKQYAKKRPYHSVKWRIQNNLEKDKALIQALHETRMALCSTAGRFNF